MYNSYTKLPGILLRKINNQNKKNAFFIFFISLQVYFFISLH